MPLDTPANSLDLISLRDIRHNTLVLKSGGLVQVLMVSGTNFALKPEDEQNIITSAYQRLLNSLGFPLQIIVHSRKVNIARYLETLSKREAEEPSPLLQNQIAEYRQFVGSFVKENPIMTKTFFVVVPYHPAGLKIPPLKRATAAGKGAAAGGFLSSFLGKKKPEEKKEGEGGNESEVKPVASSTPESTADKQFEVELEKDLQQMKQRVTHVIQGLEAVGLQAKILNDEELIELFYNFYNPETIERQDVTLPKEKEEEKHV